MAVSLPSGLATSKTTPSCWNPSIFYFSAFQSEGCYRCPSSLFYISTYSIFIGDSSSLFRISLHASCTSFVSDIIMAWYWELYTSSLEFYCVRASFILKSYYLCLLRCDCTLLFCERACLKRLTLASSYAVIFWLSGSSPRLIFDVIIFLYKI